MSHPASGSAATTTTSTTTGGSASQPPVAISSTKKQHKNTGAPTTTPAPVCTITFTECAENHIGNEQIGQKLPAGPSLSDLKKTAIRMEDWLTSRGIHSGWKLELHIFNEALDAGLLIIKGLDAVNWPAELVEEEDKKGGGEGAPNNKKEEKGEERDQRTMIVNDLDWDKKFFNSRRKVVQNKNARHNLCFCDAAQDPEYESGKGRTYAFADLPPFMRSLRSFYSDTLLVEGKSLETPLIAEGNKYYDVSSTYIGWHGDVERNIVAGFRIGGPYPLHYWAFDGVTSLTKDDKDLIWSFEMEDGWGYVMSHGASGQNWRKKEQHLRHAAGFPSVLAKKQDRVPKSWSAKKGGAKLTAKAPESFISPGDLKPIFWEPKPADCKRMKRGREFEEEAP